MPQLGHTYLRTHRLKGNVLSFALRGEATAIGQSAAYRRSGRTAKTLVNAGRLRVEVVALRTGASMAQHRAKGNVTIHVLRGALLVVTPEGPADLGPGGLLVLAPNVTHAVTARRDASFLLTLALERKVGRTTPGGGVGT